MNQEIKPLLDVMDRLLGENGCPWDREQTHQSLRRNLLEESHEVIEAIDEGDMPHLKEELGDLLLQVVFHAKLAEKSGDFTFQEVVDGITAKLKRRHPHIFGDVQADNAEQVLTNWEEIKKQEKGQTGEQSIMSDLPPTLPALIKAEKIQQKAHRVGFDWEDIEGPKAKIHEELAEIEAALAGDGNVEEELGDLLFSVVNLARFLQVDPERALTMTTNKFIMRFKAMERKIMLDKKAFGDYTVKELDMIWNEVKVSR